MLRSGTGNVWEPKTSRANLAQGVPLRLGCALESPGQTWKYLFLGPSPRDSDLIVLEYGSTGISSSFQTSQMESSVPQSWESWLQERFQILEGVKNPLVRACKTQDCWAPNPWTSDISCEEESQKVHFYQLPKWSQLPLSRYHTVGAGGVGVGGWSGEAGSWRDGEGGSVPGRTKTPETCGKHTFQELKGFVLWSEFSKQEGKPQIKAEK